MSAVFFVYAPHHSSQIYNVALFGDFTEFEFQCSNGQVITDSELICDGTDDCGDDSDEVISCNRTVTCSFESRNLCG